MSTTALGLAAIALLLSGCGSSDSSPDSSPATNNSARTCPADDPNCADRDDTASPADPLPTPDPFDPDTPIMMTFGGYFVAEPGAIRLCAMLAESFPPQCGSPVIEIDATLSTALDYVGETFGDPATAPLMNEGDVWWTDEWVNLSGTLVDQRLVLE